MVKLRQLDSTLVLLLLFSIFAWGPLLTPAYFFEAHDAKHSIFFLVEFDQTFRDGYLWPRWSPDFAFGYGYPLFNHYAPLAFYIAELFVLLGASFTGAIKTVYILATIGGGLGMYGFVYTLFDRRREAAFLAAIVYIYIPFHLVEIFVRSAYAEFVALAVIPFLFWAFTELITTPNPTRFGLAGLAYGVLALIHHTTFFTFSPLLMGYILYLLWAKNRFQIKPLLYNLGAGLLGLALAAIYLIPVIAETRYIKVEQWTSGSYNYLQHFVYFSQLFSPEWGYGYSGPGLLDDLSYQLGIVIVVLAVIAAWQQRGTVLFFLFATLITIGLMSYLAEPIWQIIPIAALVQFPWRLLAVIAFTLSVVAGSLLIKFQASPHETTTPIYLLGLTVILASFPYTFPQYTPVPAWSETPLAVINWDRASIVDRVAMVSVTEEQPQTSPMEEEYLTEGRPHTVASLIKGEGTVQTLHHGGASDIVRVTASESVALQFHTYDYPGWQVTLSGHPLEHHPEPPFGLITVDLPPGEHTVQLRMGQTTPRLVGILFSGIACLIIGISLFRKSKV